ncbi:hypothetical protein IW261DRAFT_1480188 [Armillaria novae-zelandiae]|uniref:Uncharacterized protein n=1 Tax=Armillaria novae-zelandiae TaxID=153914 RepID=A0AA39P822_9AGAR|nr:hypothetical protein IW261DRAFT_1480188 [Armillaria novae-zelandiae]
MDHLIITENRILLAILHSTIYYHFKCRARPPKVKTYSNTRTIVNLYVFSTFSGLRSSPREHSRENLMDPIDVSVKTMAHIHNCDTRMGASAAQGDKPYLRRILGRSTTRDGGVFLSPRYVGIDNQKHVRTCAFTFRNGQSFSFLDEGSHR